MEFKMENFQELKSQKNDQREKVWTNP